MYSIVADLMRVRHGSVLPESSSLREAAERLIVSDCDVLVTTDDAGRLTGVISESCVVRALLSGAAESREIRGFVSHHAVSATPTATLSTVLPLFRSAVVTVIPVVRETGEVLGLLQRRDVIAALMRNRDDSVATAGKTDGCNSRKATETARGGSREDHAADSIEATCDESAGASTLRNVPRWSPTGLAGPHFLRGAAARQALWPAEDRL